MCSSDLTIAGFAGVDRKLIDAARSMGASRFEVFRHVLYPAAFPVVLTGLRIGFFICFASVLGGDQFPAPSALTWRAVAIALSQGIESLGPLKTWSIVIGAAWAGIKTGHEAPIVKKALRRTFQAAAIPASGNLDELPTELLPVFRDNYREEALRRAASMPVLTGTPPTRMVDAGILSAALPNVRFLLVKRDVEDVTWRIYMTKYATANPYAYDLKEIRDYVGWYNAMIDLMAEKLPHTTRVVSYEDMVAQPGAVLRMAGGLCDLPPVADAPPPGDDRGCAAPYMKFLRGS